MSSTVSYASLQQHFWDPSIFCRRGPTVWNSLPDHLRHPTVDSEQFGRDLKTYLFAGIRSVGALEVLRIALYKI